MLSSAFTRLKDHLHETLNMQSIRILAEDVPNSSLQKAVYAKNYSSEHKLGELRLGFSARLTYGEEFI